MSKRQDDEQKKAREMMQQITPRIMHAMRAVPPSGNLQASFYTQYDAVTQFHVAAELPIGNMYRKVDKKWLECYRERLVEETDEALQVIDRMIGRYENQGVPVVGSTYTIEDQADLVQELVDVAYTAMGLGVVFGLPFDTAFGLVHFSNMMKVKDGPVVSEEGKVQKPEGWQPPDLLPLLMQAYADGKEAEKMAAAQAKNATPVAVAVEPVANDPEATEPPKPH